MRLANFLQPEFFSRFPDDESAKQWFIAQRWPGGICCIRCGSTNVQTGAARKRAEFRCREKDCEKQFGVKTGTFMQSSKIGYRDWLYAIYLTTTNLKGVASMKLHREIKVTQKTCAPQKVDPALIARFRPKSSLPRARKSKAFPAGRRPRKSWTRL